MAGLTLRRGVLSDAELLTELGARTFFDTFAADNTEENMSAYLQEAFSLAQLTSELSDPNSLFVIADLDDVAVGYSMLHSGKAPEAVTGDNPIEIVRLYVAQDQIGSGVGAALMQECLRESAQRDFETIWLGVWEHNHRAQAFYRKWGFNAVGTHVFQLGDDAQKDLLMSRSLASAND